MSVCLIGLGSNLGDSADILHRAADWLSRHDAIQGYIQSDFIRFRAAGGPAEQADYLNAAARFETNLSAQQLLTLLQQAEFEMGRRPGIRWGPRVLDLDLLLLDDQVLHTPNLEIPHPRMATRRFVLQPAARIAGNMVHPLFGWTIQQLWQHLNSAPPYVAIAGIPGSGKTELAQRVAQRTGSSFLRDPQLTQPLTTQPADAQSSMLEQTRDRILARAALLRHIEGCMETGYVISDFLFEQAGTYARFDDNPQLLKLVDNLQRQLEASLMTPQLKILLEPPEVQEDLNSALPTSDRIRELNAELTRLVTRPDRGPWLRLARADDSLDWAEEELVAAIQAMS